MTSSIAAGMMLPTIASDLRNEFQPLLENLEQNNTRISYEYMVELLLALVRFDAVLKPEERSLFVSTVDHLVYQRVSELRKVTQMRCRLEELRDFQYSLLERCSALEDMCDSKTREDAAAAATMAGTMSVADHSPANSTRQTPMAATALDNISFGSYFAANTSNLGNGSMWEYAPRSANRSFFTSTGPPPPPQVFSSQRRTELQNSLRVHIRRRVGITRHGADTLDSTIASTDSIQGPVNVSEGNDTTASGAPDCRDTTNAHSSDTSESSPASPPHMAARAASASTRVGSPQQSYHEHQPQQVETIWEKSFFAFLGNPYSLKDCASQCVPETVLPVTVLTPPLTINVNSQQQQQQQPGVASTDIRALLALLAGASGKTSMFGTGNGGNCSTNNASIGGSARGSTGGTDSSVRRKITRVASFGANLSAGGGGWTGNSGLSGGGGGMNSSADTIAGILVDSFGNPILGNSNAVGVGNCMNEQNSGSGQWSFWLTIPAVLAVITESLLGTAPTLSFTAGAAPGSFEDLPSVTESGLGVGFGGHRNGGIHRDSPSLVSAAAAMTGGRDGPLRDIARRSSAAPASQAQTLPTATEQPAQQQGQVPAPPFIPSPEALELFKVFCPSLHNYKAGIEAVAAAAPVLAARNMAATSSGVERSSRSQTLQSPSEQQHQNNNSLGASPWNDSTYIRPESLLSLSTIDLGILTEGNGHRIRGVDCVVHVVVSALARLTSSYAEGDTNNRSIAAITTAQQQHHHMMWHMDSTDEVSIGQQSRQGVTNASFNSCITSPTGIPPSTTLAQPIMGTSLDNNNNTVGGCGGSSRQQALVMSFADSLKDVANVIGDNAFTIRSGNTNNNNGNDNDHNNNNNNASSGDNGGCTLATIMRVEVENMLRQVEASLAPVVSMEQQVRSELGLLTFRVVSTILDWLIPAVYVSDHRTWLFYRKWVCDLYRLLYEENLLDRFSSILDHNNNNNGSGDTANNIATPGTDGARDHNSGNSKRSMSTGGNAATNRSDAAAVATTTGTTTASGKGRARKVHAVSGSTIQASHSHSVPSLRTSATRPATTMTTTTTTTNATRHASSAKAAGHDHPLPTLASPNQRGKLKKKQKQQRSSLPLGPSDSQKRGEALEGKEEARDMRLHPNLRGVECSSPAAVPDISVTSPPFPSQSSSVTTTILSGAASRTPTPDARGSTGGVPQLVAAQQQRQQREGSGRASSSSVAPLGPAGPTVGGDGGIFSSPSGLHLNHRNHLSNTPSLGGASNTPSSVFYAAASTHGSGDALTADPTALLVPGCNLQLLTSGNSQTGYAAVGPSPAQDFGPAGNSRVTRGRSAVTAASVFSTSDSVAVRAAQALLDQGTVVPIPKGYMMSRLVAAAVRGMDLESIHSLLAVFGPMRKGKGEDGEENATELEGSSAAAADAAVNPAPGVTSSSSATATAASLPLQQQQREVAGSDGGGSRDEAQAVAAAAGMSEAPDVKLGTDKLTGGVSAPPAIATRSSARSVGSQPLSTALRSTFRELTDQQQSSGVPIRAITTFVHHHRFRYPIVGTYQDVTQLYTAALEEANILLSPHDPIRAALVQNTVDFIASRAGDPETALTLLESYLDDVMEERVQPPVCRAVQLTSESSLGSSGSAATVVGGSGGSATTKGSGATSSGSTFSVTSVRRGRVADSRGGIPLPHSPQFSGGLASPTTTAAVTSMSAAGAAMGGAKGMNVEGAGAHAELPIIPLVIPSWYTREEQDQFVKILTLLRSTQMALRTRLGMGPLR